jgi:S-adenosylmethionine hydrolase
MKKRIVFITDCVDAASNELRGTVIHELAKINSENDVEIEPVVHVEPFSLINGSFLLRLMAETYPDGTLFSIILNPLKERPERLIGKTKKKSFFFVGANTGVFEWFLNDFGIAEVYELKDPGFFPFGGKYVHAPAVANLTTGVSLKEMGKEFDRIKLRKLDITPGAIVHIDNFGLMKFSEKLPEYLDNQKFTVTVSGTKTKIDAVYSKRMMSRDTGEWVIYPGSSLGLAELGKVRSNGAREINAKIGDIIHIEKK